MIALGMLTEPTQVLVWLSMWYTGCTQQVSNEIPWIVQSLLPLDTIYGIQEVIMWNQEVIAVK